MKKRTRALTLLEALIVVLIIGMLAAMLYPVFESLKMKMKVVGTVQRMQQFHIALQMYRQEWNGADVFVSYKSYHTVGLPPSINLSDRSAIPPPGLEPALPGISAKHWIGPCGYAGGVERYHPFEDGIPVGGVPGQLRLVALSYSPEALEAPVEGGGRTMNWFLYHNYLVSYKENVAVIAEFYCNPITLNVGSRYVRKRGIALLLSGQIVNKYDSGDWSDLRWFSPPPN